jgi:hypothetical protein
MSDSDISEEGSQAVQLKSRIERKRERQTKKAEMVKREKIIAFGHLQHGISIDPQQSHDVDYVKGVASLNGERCQTLRQFKWKGRLIPYLLENFRKHLDDATLVREISCAINHLGNDEDSLYLIREQLFAADCSSLFVQAIFAQIENAEVLTEVVVSINYLIHDNEEYLLRFGVNDGGCEAMKSVLSYYATNDALRREVILVLYMLNYCFDNQKKCAQIGLMEEIERLLAYRDDFFAAFVLEWLLGLKGYVENVADDIPRIGPYD